MGPHDDIVLASDRGGGYNIWVSQRADGVTRQVTHETANAHSPAWSRDGNTLAYVVDGPAVEIKVLDLVSAKKPVL